MLQYCVSGRDVKLVTRLREILALIGQWRGLARSGNIADLTWQIYRESEFLSFVSALVYKTHSLWGQKFQEWLFIACSLLLGGFGIWFMVSGIQLMI